MKYRNFGKIDFKVSALGFGMMRLPLKDQQTGEVDINETIRIVRFAIDKGLNYVDTAYVYHNQKSEEILSEVLKDGYREKVKIADKLPMWNIKDERDLDDILNTQLERLKTDKIDFYLLHALNRKSAKFIKKFNILSWLEQKRKEGKIDYIGFSFHDNLRIFKKITDLYNWDFCQIQYNIIDVTSQGGKSALKYAYEKEMGVIIMEPLRGGQLCQSLPDEVKNLWLKYSSLDEEDRMEPVQYLLDWLWDQKEVGTILSGMSDMEQTVQNVYYASKSRIGKLTEEQHKIIRKIRKAYNNRIIINCTKCNYCKICPEKIAIPYALNLINQIKQYENEKLPRIYYRFIPDENKITKCTKCGACLKVCPQNLNIPDLLDRTAQIFEGNKTLEEMFSQE